MNIIKENQDFQVCPGLDPVISPGCRVVIFGSFPSLLSLQKGEYYANPRNDFWRILETIAGIHSDLPYQERIREVNLRGIGLWDIFKTCERAGSADSSIRNAELNAVPELLGMYPEIRCLAGNGRKAESGLAALLRMGGMSSLPVDMIYLPSSSPAYAARVQEKCSGWRILLPYLD
jgi:TDG/mug DNA glycosylase family protein